ncbi:MAG: ABC transporter ATP-binding protein [Firmicutes bacterium]|nr:ABC transporter ATP-binding protein [Bacillota bacterium]MCL1954023.1 ABC transporter ATP-binding protein [Bacillota bacterium]
MKIVLEGITKEFKSKDGSNYAVKDLNLEIKDGEITALLGGSGSGKSTTLNMIAGILPTTSGKIYFGDQDITNFPMEKRNVGYVFQDYLLYPNMSIFDNIAFPLKLQQYAGYANKFGLDKGASWLQNRKSKKLDIRQRVESIAEILQLTPLLNRRPSTLSGGQQQRVAIARALIKEPAVLLLDEPFSNLDARLSLALHEELLQIQKRTGVTTVYVTHNQEDAMFVSNSIAILKDGTCMQNSSPQELYTNPRNFYVANFIGKLPINYVSGQIVDGKFVSDDAHIQIELLAENKIDDRQSVLVCFRPEGAEVAKYREEQFEALVVNNSFHGKDVMLKVKAGNTFMTVVHTRVIDEPQSKVGIAINPKYIKFFDKSTGESLK